MKAIITAVDGSALRYYAEDGTSGWVRQRPRDRLAVGDIVEAQDGWGWLDPADDRGQVLELYARKTAHEREEALRAVTKLPKTRAQHDREVIEAITSRRRRGR